MSRYRLSMAIIQQSFGALPGSVQTLGCIRTYRKLNPVLPVGGGGASFHMECCPPTQPSRDAEVDGVGDLTDT